MTVISVRSNTATAFIFRWLQYMGFWIPENLSQFESHKWPTLLEVFSMVITLISVGFTVFQLLHPIKDYSKMVNLSPAIVVFNTYFLVIVKTVYLWVRKKTLLGLFKSMDDIANFPAFAQHQKLVVNFICANVRKTTLYLIWIGMVFVTFMLTSYFIFSFFGDPKNKQSWTEFFILDMTKFGTDALYTIKQSVPMFLFCLHFMMFYFMHARNFLMDSVMILCHYFVVQQLNLLNRLFCHPPVANAKIMHIKSQFFSTMKQNGTEFDDWIVMFNKIKRFHQETNTFFGFYCIVLVACTMTTLCFVSFTASKQPTVLIIITYSMIGIILIMQVFSCCKSGQNVKEAADRVTDTVCTGPWMDHALADSLHLIAVDLQRSFIVRGGPFFNLNLEFFASMMGAVFTYYVVLVQMRD